MKPRRDPKEFVEYFCSVPKKLKKRVDLKRILEKQVEERHEIH